MSCPKDGSTAQAYQSGEIAAFAIGGAFLAASTILLIAAPRTPRERASVARTTLHCGAGPGIAGIACGGVF
jgi:hypothetical protein